MSLSTLAVLLLNLSFSSALFAFDQPATDAVDNGKALFAGTARFQNGGPPCAACHAVSGLPFPNGGSLGPDLSRSAAKLGPQGINVALQTLYFPTMRPVFDAHPLTAFEQADLRSFLEQAQRGPLPPNIFPLLALIGFFGLVVLLAFTWGVWRHRLRGVRKELVQSVSAGDARQ